MTTPLKIVVLISGNGSNLQALINATLTKKTFKIVGVISNNAEALGIERAKKVGIRTEVISDQLYKKKADFESEMIRIIDQQAPDVIALAGFMRVLSPEFVSHYPFKIINIHPSLLPAYAGLNTHERVLKAGEKWHGVTIHVVNEGLDSGPILAQQKVMVREDDTIESLRARVLEVEHHLYPWVLDRIATGQLSLKPFSLREKVSRSDG